jgi:hypothetical protein
MLSLYSLLELIEMYVIYIQCLNILGGSALCILAVAFKIYKTHGTSLGEKWIKNCLLGVG